MYGHISIPRHRDLIQRHNTTQLRPIGKAAARRGLGGMPGHSLGIDGEDLQPTISVAASSDLMQPCFIAYSHPALEVPIGAVLPVRPSQASRRIDREDL